MKRLSSKWRWIGALIVGAAVVLAWLFGLLTIIFSILGVYATIYFISLIFQTTKIIDAILSIFGFIIWGGMSILGLYVLYLVLQYMFEGSFLLGLLILIFGIPIFQMVAYGLIAALGAPLFWFSSDLDQRFGQESKNPDYATNAKEVENIAQIDAELKSIFCKNCGKENRNMSDFCVRCGTPRKK